MCGISGCYSFRQERPALREEVQHMTDMLAHRGPDAYGIFFDGTAALGHRRLSILDTSSAANQPMHSADNRYTIVYNGEVYNYKEVKNKYKLSTRTSSDTEVILEAFIKKGPHVVNELNGMFAFAIYDSQDKELHLFRDRLGVKPLYYYYDEDIFAFGSELKALATHPAIRKILKLNRESISQFLQLGYIPEPNTIYKGILKFPSGHYLCLGKKRMDLKAYWENKSLIEDKPFTALSAAKQELEDLMLSSVQYRLVSDVPYGSLLSGGTDSSLVTALAQKLTGNLNTFSIGFKEAKYNESHHAKKIAQYLGTRHHELTVTHQDAAALVDGLTTIFDEPFADSSAIPTLLVSKLARQHVKMVLSGDGGDELFLGYGAYKWAKRLNLPAVKALRKPLAYSLSMLGNREKRAALLFNYPDPKKLKRHIFSQEQYLFSEQETEELLTPSYRYTLDPEPAYRNLRRELNPEEAQALFDMDHYLKDDLLVKVDRCSMHYGLETRAPFLDYRVVHFALNLATSLKIKKGVDKFLLKEILYRHIPKKHFDRPKWGFAMPLKEWLKKELRYLIADHLSEKSINTYGLIHYDYVQKLKAEFDAGRDYLYNRIWALIVLHKFLKEQKLKG